MAFDSLNRINCLPIRRFNKETAPVSDHGVITTHLSSEAPEKVKRLPWLSCRLGLFPAHCSL
jgi:hypothetical protein